MVVLMVMLLVLDVAFVYYAASVSWALKGPSMFILFGFEVSLSMVHPIL
jgi:hypothetical protein